MWSFIDSVRQIGERDASYGLVGAYHLLPLLADPTPGPFDEALLALPADELSRAIDGLCLSHGHSPKLVAYLREPASELKQLLRGAHYLFLAWEKRGMAVASSTSTQQFEGFDYYLNLALTELNRPFETPAYQYEALARLVRVGMGLSEPEFSREAFEAVRQDEPTHLLAHLHYLRVVSPWWHGSLHDLTAFVDSIPPGPLRQTLLCVYLCEVESYLSSESSARDAAAQLRTSYAAALSEALAGPELRPENTFGAIYYNNYRAALHHLLGQAGPRRRILRHLGTRVTPYPWLYAGLESVTQIQWLAWRPW